MISSALSVAQLNFFIKSVLESEPRLRRVAVVGELSNFVRHYKSGHMYFSLKDETAAVKAVMFRADAAKLRFAPRDGMSVVVTGRVSVFERDGVYQLYAESMVPAGAGALAAAYEQLKKKLAAEGLFDPLKKRPLPAYPTRIGVVTSSDGAAVRDIFQILSRRWPLAEVVLCPALVQGAQAAESVAAAIRLLNARKACDVMIVGRGGGSAEDLWAFNEEPLVRAVAASDIPVISAVGHETDVTLCDFAADMRAPTPSAAAELVAPDKTEQLYALADMRRRLKKATDGRIAAAQEALSRYGGAQGKNRIQYYIESNMQYCDSLSERLALAANRKTDAASAALSRLAAALTSLNPLQVLARGYAVCEKDGAAVAGVDALRAGDRVTVLLADGEADCEVKETRKLPYGKNDV